MPIMSITAIVIVVILVLIGLPVAVSLGLSTAVVILIYQPSPLSTIPQQIWGGMEIYALVAVPFFVLSGVLMEKLGAAKILVNFSNSIVGWTKGGLGSVNIIASFIFGGISGSSIADTAALGTLLIPRMKEEGYDLDYSGAVTLASSTLAVIVPPSIPIVLWGVVAEKSVGRLLIGGVIPGALFALLMLIYNYVVSSRKGYGSSVEFSFKYFLKMTKVGLPALGAPIIIIASIFTGFVTPSEAGGLAAIYVVIISYLFFKDFTWRKALDSMIDGLTLSGAILFIVANARLFTWLLIREGVPDYLANVLDPLIDTPVLLMISISLILLVAGMFIDLSISILVFTPLFLPLANLAGIDPIHFGIIFVITLAIGLTTPPFGLCLYSVSLVGNIDVITLSKATFPFYILMYVGILILILFPRLVLFLPSLI
jgi:tripartite ATP-independent transporter DctM subunit